MSEVALFAARTIAPLSSSCPGSGCGVEGVRRRRKWRMQLVGVGVGGVDRRGWGGV